MTLVAAIISDMRHRPMSKEMKRKNKRKILEELCNKNGRYLEIIKEKNKPYQYITADIYTGCDSHYSSNIDEAIEWELGYN